MSRQKKTNRKTSTASSSSSSMCSMEDSYMQTIETSQSSSISSSNRSIYPNVPKRTRPLLSTDDHGTIQTESRIDIIPSGRHSSRAEGFTSNRIDNRRHGLDLLLKYTSPAKTQSDYHPLSPIQSEINISNDYRTTIESKSKRTLSPLNEIEQEESRNSKRPKPFNDDDDDDDEISEFIDHRRHRSKASQISNTSISSQGSEQRKETVRKPTVRKLSTNQQKSSASQPIIIEPLSIEHDTDLELTNWSTNDILPISNIQQNENEISHHSISTPIIPNDSHHENTQMNSTFTPIEICTPIRPIQQTLSINPIDNSSPCSNKNIVSRRLSSTSSASLFFDTPNSSFSRTTTTMNITTSTPQPVMKINRETEIFTPLYSDMINKLIIQMNLSVCNDKHNIDYNPNELSKQFFEQSSLFFTNNKHYSTQFYSKKQFINFGRYEIEIVYPTNENQKSTVHVCDICLKYFSTSSIAFQRHTAKCLSTQPPGKLIFTKDNLAIFQINEIPLTLIQRIYLKSLYRISQLFINPIKIINDSKIDRFNYYILCRHDPIISSTQPIIYRFIGYFTQQRYEHSSKLFNNLSRLFILPPFSKHYDYEQLLISLSYSLIRLNSSTTNIICSPTRPLDYQTLNAFRNYWLNILSKYLFDQHCSSSFSLDSFTRQTSIHPRDILSSLYSSSFLIRHSKENSSIYLNKNAYHSMTCLNRQDQNKFLHLDRILIDMNDKKKQMMIDKTKNVQEIILD